MNFTPCAAKGLLDAIMARLDEDTEYVFPIVQLGTDNYRHKKWGKTYTPVFDIVDWVALDANAADVADVEPADDADEAPRRRRRAVA